jgi:cell shape-determining protein MreC
MEDKRRGYYSGKIEQLMRTVKILTEENTQLRKELGLVTYTHQEIRRLGVK